MSIVNLSKNELAKSIVLFAIGEDFVKIGKMEVIKSDNGDLIKDVKLIVGGVELDFEEVVKRLGDQFDTAVKEKVAQTLSTKIGAMINQLNDMQQYIEDHSDLFKPDWK